MDIAHARVFFKPEFSPALEAAENTRTGGIFLDFARFPWANVSETENGYEVTIRDLRFYSPTERRPGFIAEVVMNKQLKTVSQKFSFRGAAREAAN